MPAFNSRSEKDQLSENSRIDVEKKRKQIYQSMSAKEKVEAAADLYYSALHLKQAHIKSLHPEWPEEKIEKKTREWMLYAKT